MTMSSSQKITSESKMVPKLRAVMPADLFRAAIKGDSKVLVQRLGLQSEEQTEVQVTIEDSHSAPEQIKTAHPDQSELQSATGFGDTILHLLVAKEHNELALKVCQIDKSLLKARNKMSETPLHCAAKVGNEKFINNLNEIDPDIIKDALEETNKNRDTPLHVAAKHGHKDVGHELMKLNPQVARKINNKMFSPLYIAITNGYNKMAQTMLQLDPTLACTQFSDGMFPVHVAAQTGNYKLVLHFMKKYADDAELLDPCGRNIFHIAAEEDHKLFFWEILKDTSLKKMIARMNDATDYQKNTPLHVAAMKGGKFIMETIWTRKMNLVAETVRNNQGFTPLQLSMLQLFKLYDEDVKGVQIGKYHKTEGDKFTRKWFDDIMQRPLENKWEKTQVIGLGSVLITTVSFAAAFTIPGGYNPDDGNPLLGRRYVFRTFILANALAFIQGFLSLFALLARALPGIPFATLQFAVHTFLLAASSMVVAFGLGMYLTLAPVCLPIAILLLVITLFLGSPAVLFVTNYGQICLRIIYNMEREMILWAAIVAFYAWSFLLIFCLPLVL